MDQSIQLIRNKDSGFTLIEILIVLSIFSVLLSIFGALQVQVLDQYKTRHNLTLLQDDILYMQKRTMVKKENLQLYIYPEKHTYEIKQGGLGKILLTRQLPKSWKIELNTLTMPIAFTTNGTIKNPGIMTIVTQKKEYKVYFPFGKGRCYIIES